MKITKYEHACVVIEEQGKRVVIDPGVMAADFGGTDNVVAVVVTHVHDDHFGEENVRKIIAANPEATIYTTQEVANKLPGAKTVVPEVYEDYTAEPFRLRFFGELHAEMHHEIPRPENIGVSVNGRFYYPGDSFTPPDHNIEVLAIPSGAGWLKLSEAVDFLQGLDVKQAFPTHNYSLSETGKEWANGTLSRFAKEQQTAFTPLKPSESIEI